MTVAIFSKALSLWVGILIIAILNGALREKMLIPIMGAGKGLAASGIVLASSIFLVALFAAPWYGRLSSSQWWGIGFFWLVLTLAFETGFGRFIQHKEWVELFRAYTFTGGNLWPVVLLATLVSPWAAARLRALV